jgi:hypothetical protein
MKIIMSIILIKIPPGSTMKGRSIDRASLIMEMAKQKQNTETTTADR